MLLGCIGDDFTGSSDLSNTLAKQGMQTVQYTGIPTSNADPNVEAGVVALKSRSIPAKQAVQQSLEALHWLQAQGCQQFLFKYCSTFDSTPKGNIGPVCDALADALEAHRVIVCPAFPGTGRSIYQGHLFVNDVLLSESGMENHPLTPMTDPDIRRCLAPQTKYGVGHVAAADVRQGPQAIIAALEQQQNQGNRLIVVDATSDGDLLDIGTAATDLALITGGSGIALGLPENFRRRGLLTGDTNQWFGQEGKCAILSGSCSNATRAQVALHSKSNPSFEIEAAQVIENQLSAATLSDWLLSQPGLPLAYSSADPDIVRQVQQQFGRQHAAEKLEAFFADVARHLLAGGVERLITAGGETSGAVIEGLALKTLEIGPEIAPGVPALRAGDNLVIALKSGNFGGPTFFDDAATTLSGQAHD